MEPLVELAAGGRRRYILLRDDGTIDVEGMSDPLRELRYDEEMIRLLGYDVDCRRYGLSNVMFHTLAHRATSVKYTLGTD